MPYHLELGSEGRSFAGKAIVVNSRTGEHYSKHPIPLDDAKAQMRVLEEDPKYLKEEKVAGTRREALDKLRLEEQLTKTRNEERAKEGYKKKAAEDKKREKAEKKAPYEKLEALRAELKKEKEYKPGVKYEVKSKKEWDTLLGNLVRDEVITPAQEGYLLKKYLTNQNYFLYNYIFMKTPEGFSMSKKEK